VFRSMRGPAEGDPAVQPMRKAGQRREKRKRARCAPL
jgi:hypothetical protein